MKVSSLKAASAGKLSILIVEDDKFLHKILVTKFGNEGFEVRGATDGEEALRQLKTFRPSVILLDIILPKKDGFEVLREAKSDSEIADIPVVILTNLSQAEDRRRAAELGAVDYLVKSDISMDNLVERVRTNYVKHHSEKH